MIAWTLLIFFDGGATGSVMMSADFGSHQACEKAYVQFVDEATQNRLYGFSKRFSHVCAHK